MVALISGMLLCVGVAVSVMGIVAIPARREARSHTNAVEAVSAAQDSVPQEPLAHDVG